MESVQHILATARLGFSEIASRLTPSRKRPRGDGGAAEPAPSAAGPAAQAGPSEAKRARRASAPPQGILREAAGGSAAVFAASERASALPPEMNGGGRRGGGGGGGANPFAPVEGGGTGMREGSAVEAGSAVELARPRAVRAVRAVRVGGPEGLPLGPQLFVSPSVRMLRGEDGEVGVRGSMARSGGASVRARAYSVRQTALDESARKRSVRKYRDEREVRRLSFGARTPAPFGGGVAFGGGTPLGGTPVGVLDVTSGGEDGRGERGTPMSARPFGGGLTPRVSAVGGGVGGGEEDAVMREREKKREREREKQRLEEQKLIQAESREIAERVAREEKLAGPLPRGLRHSVAAGAGAGLAGVVQEDDVQLTGVYPAVGAGAGGSSSTTQHLLRQYPSDFVDMLDSALFREKMTRAKVNIDEFATYDVRKERRQKRLHAEQEKLAKLRADSLLHQRQLDGDFDVDAYVHKVREASLLAGLAVGGARVDEPDEDSMYIFNYTDDGGEEWDEELDVDAADPEKRVATVMNEASAFSPLTPLALKRVRHYMSDQGPQRQLVAVDRIPIGLHDIHRLSPGCWLNDEIINGYMELIRARSKRFEEDAGDDGPGSAAKSRPRVQVVNTFFYPKLSGCNSHGEYDYTQVRRWTKKFDVFASDYLLVPINSSNVHWTLAVVNFKDKRVEYYDSLGSTNQKVLANLLRWVGDELDHKKNEVFDASEWSTVGHGQDVPQQDNSDDCGVFLCKFADFVARGAEINFSSAHMSYFRARMANELLVARLA